MDTLTLFCPIRGPLKTGKRSKDGLRPSEEFFRVEAIKHLLKLGYPKSHFKIEAVVKRFGNAGRNSFRADFAVLDVPASTILSGDVDELLNHAIVLCEVKRDDAKTEYVTQTQVKPLLDFARLTRCLALYWDNVEQRVFWNDWVEGKKNLNEGPLAFLPKYGQAIKAKPLCYGDLTPTDNLLDLFRRIEDILHANSIDLEQRYSVILQLLLAKLHDEHAHQTHLTAPLAIQDYEALGQDATSSLGTFDTLLRDAVSHYQHYLPRTVDERLPNKVTGSCFIAICKMLAPVLLTASKRDVMQTFYMTFAKGLYKWDLAQFFTPPTVTDFIVDVLNPQFGEHIKDPACGSADFLTAAFHKRRNIDPNYADFIWGADNSTSAVQVAVLNMLLNGDGKSNIKEVDSLEHVDAEQNHFEILVCNPPFGVRILERRPSVLRAFDLGHEWDWDETQGRYVKRDRLLKTQQSGILFVEACVRQAKPETGRIGIILPNGYLGNRSATYRVFREWLLRHTRIAAICSFPRFTFKTSGADVSASVVYLVKRKEPIPTPSDDTTYHFTVQMIENVGWNLGDKKAAPRYRRNPEDGSYIVGLDGERELDADFEATLSDLRSSAASHDFPWLVSNIDVSADSTGWSIPSSDVVHDPDLTLDPKRYCRKVVTLRQALEGRSHFRLDDLVDFHSEQTTAQGARVKAHPQGVYEYVEIQDIGQGEYRSTTYRGWELPQRARHFAEPGDIYIGAIWGSVAKWCYVPETATNLVLTSGCHRLRMKQGQEQFLPDLLSFLCCEAYAVQMRAIARGSDGLAEVTLLDAKQVVVPRLDAEARHNLEPYVNALIAGTHDLVSKLGQMTSGGSIEYPEVPLRPSHVVLV